jgi:hypothetical protein
MTQEDVAVLLAVLGGTVLVSAWIGRRSGDAARDVWFTLGTGGALLASGCWALLA